VLPVTTKETKDEPVAKAPKAKEDTPRDKFFRGELTWAQLCAAEQS